MVRALCTAAFAFGPLRVVAALLLCVVLNRPTFSAEPTSLSLAVSPATIELAGPDSRYQLLIDGISEKGEPADVTRRCQFKSLAPEIVSVSAEGVVRGLKDGNGVVEATLDGKRIEVTVTVQGSAVPRRFNFDNHVVPIL